MAYPATALLSLLASLRLPSAGMPMVQRVFASLPDIKRVEDSAGANIGLWVDPKGKVISCEVLVSVGNENVSSQFCRPLIGYEMQNPRAADGTPSYGYVRTTVFAFPDGRRMPEQWLQELRARRIDAGEAALLKSALAGWSPSSSVFVFLEVGEDGRVAACERGSSKSDKALTAELCGNLIGRTLDAQLTIEGRPVRYVRTLGAIAG